MYYMVFHIPIQLNITFTKIMKNIFCLINTIFSICYCVNIYITFFSMLDQHQRMIHTTCKQLGLGESDISIFLLGLEMWATSIANLAKRADMWRVTVHEIVRRLIDKGLFLESYSGKKRVVYANDIEILHDLVSQKQLALETLKKNVDHTTSLLRWIQQQSEHFPRVRYYKWQEWVQRMVHEMITDREDVALVSDGQHFYDLIDNDFLDKSLLMRQKYNVSVRMMFPTWFEYFHFTQSIEHKDVLIKFLPLQADLKGGIAIRWNKVAHHCYQKRFLTTTIIDHASIADMMRCMVQWRWGHI